MLVPGPRGIPTGVAKAGTASLFYNRSEDVFHVLGNEVPDGYFEEVRPFMNCLATFKTTSMALLFERACRSVGVKARIVPVPRKLSSSCGLACDFPCENRGEVERIALQDKIEVAAFHEMEA